MLKSDGVFVSVFPSDESFKEFKSFFIDFFKPEQNYNFNPLSAKSKNRFFAKLLLFKIFNTLKEIYLQLTSNNTKAFREFVIAHPFSGSSTGVPAFIVESYLKDDKEIFIVFAPTVPNPTSGFSYHLEAKNIDRYPDVPIDKAFRTILSCGAGTADLLHNKPIIESEVLTKGD